MLQVTNLILNVTTSFITSAKLNHYETMNEATHFRDRIATGIVTVNS